MYGLKFGWYGLGIGWYGLKFGWYGLGIGWYGLGLGPMGEDERRGRILSTGLLGDLGLDLPTCRHKLGGWQMVVAHGNS